MSMDGLKLWSQLRTINVSEYPQGKQNVTSTVQGLKNGMDVYVLNSSAGGIGQTEIVSGLSGPVDVSNIGGINSLAVRITDLVLSHLSDSIGIGANGVIVSDAAPFPVKLIPAPSTVTLNATSTVKTANYTEPANALNITIICDSGSCSLSGGRVLTSGESMTFSAPNGYQLSAFAVTFISGQFTINVVR
jgi:hypothetical protein